MDLETTITAPFAIEPPHTERLVALSFETERVSWLPVREDDVLTEPCMALTVEASALDAPSPLAEPLTGEPAYLVEARPPAGSLMLIAVRETLAGALSVADAVHPSVADVVIREVQLPITADGLVDEMGSMRAWTREPDGTWWPPIERPAPKTAQPRILRGVSA